MSFETVRVSGIKLWLDGPEGRAHAGAMGAGFDELNAENKAGVKLRWPLPGCIDGTDDAALYHAGEHRRILRAPSEDGEAYRDRLKRAPLYWYWAGTKAGLLQPFEPFAATYPHSEYTPASQSLYRLDIERDAGMIALQRSKGRVDPTLWSAHFPPTCDFVDVKNNGETGGFWDGNEHWFSRVFFFVDAHLDDPDIWGIDGLWDDDGDWDDGGLWDVTMTALEAAYLRSQIRRTKSPGSYPTTIAIWLPLLPDDGFWDSPGVWDDGDGWAYEPTSDPLYITLGNVWGQEAWLGAYGEYPLTDIWPEVDDGLGGWVAFEGDPLQR